MIKITGVCSTTNLHLAETCGENQTLLIFISNGVSHVQRYWSAQNKTYKVIVYLLERGS